MAGPQSVLDILQLEEATGKALQNDVVWGKKYI
jgi:hypothetical protein